MYPYLDQNHYFPTYGVLFFIGIISSILVSLCNNKRKKINKDDMMYASSFALIGGILGAKLLFIVSNINIIIENNINFTDIIKSGFVFYGGFLGGALGYFIYAKLYKISVIDFYDNAVCSLPLGQFFGRLGCFFAGCCYGRPTDSIIGIIYTNPADPNTPTGIKLLPVQLFEALFCLVLFFVIFFINKKELKKGTKMLVYLFSYSTFRFINEFFRYDFVRGGIGFLSTSQIISILLFMFALFYLLYTRFRNSKKNIFL